MAQLPLPRRSGPEPGLSDGSPLAIPTLPEGPRIVLRTLLECARERRETRGAHNRVDFPEQDPGLQVNLVWAVDGTIDAEPIPQSSAAVASLGREPDPDIPGRLLE